MHEPMLASLKPGTVKVRPAKGEPLEFDVESGVLSIDQDVVTILVQAGHVIATPK